MANSNNLEQSVQSLPLQSYYDEKNFEDELTAIWQNEWIYACHEKSLSEPLSYITLKISNYNVVILRDKNNQLVADNDVYHFFKLTQIICPTPFRKYIYKNFNPMHNEHSDTHFQLRIDNGEHIEAKDYMPEKYRKHLIRQMSQHAHSEVIGPHPPSPKVSITK